jgi:uncharacterized protein (DUF952 family)
MILHLLPEAVWREAREHATYRPATYPEDGFVHCSAGDDVMLAVADAVYANTSDQLVVWEVDESRLTSPVRWEAAEPAPPPGVSPATRFPHVYGPINLDAVTGARRLVRAEDGRFVGYTPID